jgi:protoporphyrinogen oxidase
MRIAILGGGITGLTAAYYLSKKGHQITIIEKEMILGGLASGFKDKDWKWYLERTYHHLFASDSDILNFAKEIGFEKIYFKKPITSSLFIIDKKMSTFPLDTPIDLLKFPLLGIIDKIRAGIIIVFLKLSPFFSFYNKITSEEFLKKSMGNNVWNVMWRQLFRGKFGKYAGIVSSAFIWTRINKRTKALGYIEGGFQEFINYLERLVKSLGADIQKGVEIKEIQKKGDQFLVNGIVYDKIISTLPTPVMTKLTKNIFSDEYLSRFSKLKYLHAVILVLETSEPILKKTYWLNICTDKIPFMILAQHTNFADKKNYNDNCINYIGWYVDGDSPLLKMKNEDILKMVKPHLEKIGNMKLKLNNYFVFKAPWAQPIFDKDFEKNKPDFITPDKNFFIANLDMTYPYDRGTNYAVKLGKEVVKMI